MWATCHTDGCVNAGVPVDVGDLTYTDDDGNPHTSAVQCGPCGQPIDDVSDTAPAGEVLEVEPFEPFDPDGMGKLSD